MLHLKFVLRCYFLYLLTGFLSLSFAYPSAPWFKEYVGNIEDAYEETVVSRAKRLESLILEHARRPDEEKLAAVNEFFNKVQWISDSLNWGKNDYWQTPLETLIEFKGDCEDIAIAKYAALRAMGVPEEKLALVYAKTSGEPHILLVFFQPEDDDPVILDNTSNVIMKASIRSDLIPVYGFNSTSLWLMDRQMRKFGKAMPVPASHKLALN